MRASRLLVAVLALALLGLVPSTSSASAAKPVGASAGRAALAVSAERAAAKAPRLTAKIVKRKGGKLIMTGIIRPKKGPVVVERATSCNRKKGTCNFSTYRKSKITKKGRYSVRVYAPRKGAWAWRAVKGDQVSEVWLTCVKTPGESCPIP